MNIIAKILKILCFVFAAYAFHLIVVPFISPLPPNYLEKITPALFGSVILFSLSYFAYLIISKSVKDKT